MADLVAVDSVASFKLEIEKQEVGRNLSLQILSLIVQHGLQMQLIQQEIIRL
jgi:hypothetical protein